MERPRHGYVPIYTVRLTRVHYAAAGAHYPQALGHNDGESSCMLVTSCSDATTIRVGKDEAMPVEGNTSRTTHQIENSNISY